MTICWKIIPQATSSASSTFSLILFKVSACFWWPGCWLGLPSPLAGGCREKVTGVWAKRNSGCHGIWGSWALLAGCLCKSHAKCWPSWWFQPLGHQESRFLVSWVSAAQGLHISPVKERAAVPCSVSLGSQQVSGFLPHALCPSLSAEQAFSSLGAFLHSGQPEELGSPGNKLKKCPHPSKAFPSHKNVLIVSFCVPAQHSFAFIKKNPQFGTKDSLLTSSGYFISLFGPYLDTHQDTLTGEPEAIGSHGN